MLHSRLQANRSERDRVETVRREICQILHDQIGHDFTGYKERTFLRRIERRMQVLGVSGIEQYLAHLRGDHQEVTLLFHDLLIGVTAFFRDHDAFRMLAQRVIPELFADKGASDTIRVWVPGCATGEEVYSLAIMLLEHMDTLRARPKVMCFATDIDEAAVAVARAGRYPAAMLQQVGADRLDRFFIGEGASYVVNKEVRDLCIFSSQSVIRDPPFSHLDLISCRNLLIYLEKSLQRQIIPVFHYALRPEGYLFLGVSESVAEYGHLFTVVDKQFRIFRRREHPGTPLQLPLTVPEASRRLGLVQPRPVLPNQRPLPLHQVVESRIVEQFAPAHVVVTSDGDAVYFSTRTGKYLESAAGAPTRNIIAMARRGLRFDLRTALAEAVEARRPVHRANIRIEFNGRIQILDLIVEPMSSGGEEPLFLIVLTDTGPSFGSEPLLPVVSDEHVASIEYLERELHDTRERLQPMVEQYETTLEELKSANEELQSANEELQSANEELETSHEETQSINEELDTVNSELHRKVEELDHANNNLRNLFNGTEIAMVFLDRQLVIRNFTPAIRNIFRLLDVDRGRPLTNIVSDLADLNLRDEVEAVLADGKDRERKAVHRDGKTRYLMRVLPYRAAENMLDGVLVTFTDITRIAEAEEYQRELAHRIETLLQIVLRVVERSAAADAVPKTVLSRLHALSASYALLSRAGWGEVALADLVAGELASCGIGGDGPVVVAGPAVLLRAKATVSIGMALHEVAANASERGALSVPEGRVRVDWQIEEPQTPDARLVIRWRESGGPAVSGSAIEGYGSELIETALQQEIGATGSLFFTDGGVSADLTLPMSSDLIVLPSTTAGAGH
jgi:two-component system CheB/CheR fusion protein